MKKITICTTLCLGLGLAQSVLASDWLVTEDEMNASLAAPEPMRARAVPVPGAPDGVSVVGTIVVGASVVGGAVGANVGVDVVGASVGAAAALSPSHPGCSAGAGHGNMVVA
jgi:hypothetical protein